ncbi:MAG: NUDIX hydrolase [Candidatus Rhabdochlamydia sp.]
MSSSVVCILMNQDQVLLIKRRDIPVWVLPGGGIDPGESPEECAVREMQEETGLTTTIKRKIGEYSPLNKLTRYTHFFEMTLLSGTLTLTDETADIQFFKLGELPSHMPPPYPDWIEDALLFSPTLIQKKLTQITYLKLFKTLLRHPFLVIRFLLTKIHIHLNSPSVKD